MFAATVSQAFHPSLLGEMETEKMKLDDALYINDKRGNEFLESRQRIATNYFPIRQVPALLRSASQRPKLWF